MKKIYTLNGVPGFKNGRLQVHVSKIWFTTCDLYLDDNKIEKHDGRYHLVNESNEKIVLKLKRIGFDLVPQVSINEGRAEPMLSPAFNIFDNLWIALPFWALSLSFTIGALLVVFLCFYINNLLMRKYIFTKMRYFWTFIPTLLSFALLLKISEMIHQLH